MLRLLVILGGVEIFILFLGGVDMFLIGDTGKPGELDDVLDLLDLVDEDVDVLDLLDLVDEDVDDLDLELVPELELVDADGYEDWDDKNDADDSDDADDNGAKFIGEDSDTERDSIGFEFSSVLNIISLFGIANCFNTKSLISPL